ncbi:class II glutamine amidotransferase [Lichenihabitans sp. PAMC28606]|uniref:class II glutamine amidotransferase n=1 Tax=Lichenihabitans sp. PAMC28606 TaxID=2880932 RepID=UPI001D0A1F7C|nr:class II glutamine amidotransferase [Lichenihabitans sp. PAMC28606]UDL94991.1 class II glutamine amidotransferase [Lichenihabitans sp. PAMC28606]
MCRWIAYQGQPIYLDALVATPERSLIAQSMCAAEAKVTTNGDGFGVGWYGERETPGLYREVRPAWSDENLKSLCFQVRSALFFAHVRASTGPATARANCHPFAVGKYMFMHNGQIGNYCAIKRQLDALIPDDLYPYRSGTTDSEALFLAAFAHGLRDDPVAAVIATLSMVHSLMLEARIAEPLRATLALTDGKDLYAFRWASDACAPTLYWRQTEHDLMVVSEPLDRERAQWREVPQNCVLVARAGAPVTISRLDDSMRQAA